MTESALQNLNVHIAFYESVLELLVFMYFSRRWMQMMIKLLKLGFVSFCICNSLLLLYVTLLRKPDHDALENNKDLDCSRMFKPNDHKIILFWTRFFRRDDFEFGIGGQVFAEAKCPVHNCMTTTNRTLLPMAHAVVFHVRNMVYRDLPTFRSPCQRWIFLLYESPQNTHLNLKQYAGLFNWTMTYRWDSDIGGPPSLVRKLTAPSLQPNRNYGKGKKKFAAWFVSNCDTFSQRENLVEQLQRYVAVDMYGDCGNFSCPREVSAQCFRNVERDYKFYLSLENSICEDYVTEKAFDVLGYNVVPVVYGGGNYSRLLPPRSFIDALDFESAEHLAKYLIQVGLNDTLYNSYFEWRREYGLRKNNHWCTLCAKLTDDSEPQKTYADIDNWWNGNKNCFMGYEMKILGLNSFQKVWYWCKSRLVAYFLFKNV